MNQHIMPEGDRQVVEIDRQGDIMYTYYNDGLVKITKFRKKKIYWGRVMIAAAVFILLMFGFVQLFKAIGSALKKDSGSLEQKSPTEPAFVFDGTVEKNNAGGSAKEDSDGTSSETVSETKEPGYSGIELKVCIDPGHGDVDFGGVGGEGMLEKDQDLELSLMIKEYLESCGVTVTMTRESDTNVSLSDRCSKANQAGSDLFVSIHRTSDQNSLGSTNGVQVWVNNKQPRYDTALAQNILNALSGVGISRDLGVRYGYDGLPDSNYQVNMDTVMPSCMVDLGFITDDTDNQLFDQHKQEYARAIGDAMIKTAVDLGVVSENGERLLNEQLLSDGKSNVTMN